MSQQTRSQVKPLPKTSFTPVQSNLLQRKCGCGRSASLTGQCSECQRKKLAPERGLTDLANESEAPPVVHEVLRSSFPKIQPKLKVSQPNDKYEQEADRFADQIMRMPQPSVRHQLASDQDSIQPKLMDSQLTPLVHKQTKSGNSDPKELQRKSEINGLGGSLLYQSATRAAVKAIENGGQPLSQEMLSYFEPRLGQSLETVRVHNDRAANTAVRGLQARAFTIGQNIAFAHGAYNPNNWEGRKLIAHELVHTLQQDDAKSIDKIYRKNGLHTKMALTEKNGLHTKMELTEIISDIRGVQYDEISPEYLKGLDVDELQIVFDETVTQIKAYKGMKRSSLALDFLTYNLAPEVRRRAGFQARFEPGVGEALRGVYTTENLRPGGERIGCMEAVYEGLKVMMPEKIVEEKSLETVKEGTAIKEKRKEEAKKKGKKLTKDEIVRGTITLSRFMKKLHLEGRAGPSTALKYQPRTGKWTPDPEQHLLKLSETDEPGWFFFGVNMHSYHTGILAVDRTDITTPKIYWLDQFGDRNRRKEKEGFHRELTGKVDELFKEFKPSFGFADTKIWQILIPPKSTETECVVDDTKP